MCLSSHIKLDGVLHDCYAMWKHRLRVCLDHLPLVDGMHVSSRLQCLLKETKSMATEYAKLESQMRDGGTVVDHSCASYAAAMVVDALLQPSATAGGEWERVVCEDTMHDLSSHVHAILFRLGAQTSDMKTTSRQNRDEGEDEEEEEDDEDDEKDAEEEDDDPQDNDDDEDEDDEEVRHWKLCKRTRNALEHIFLKATIQRCSVRRFEAIVESYMLRSADIHCLVNRLVLCTLLGNYRHVMDATSRPRRRTRLWLYRLFGGDLAELTRANKGYCESSMEDDPATLNEETQRMLFRMDLLRYCREVYVFAIREYMICCIDDCPAMRQAIGRLFDYDRFRQLTLQGADRLRHYISRHLYPKQTKRPVQTCTMVGSELWLGSRHVHPHTDTDADADGEDKEQNPVDVDKTPKSAGKRKSSSAAAIEGGKRPKRCKGSRLGRLQLRCYEFDIATFMTSFATKIRHLSYQKPLTPIMTHIGAFRKWFPVSVDWKQSFALQPVRMFAAESSSPSSSSSLETGESTEHGMARVLAAQSTTEGHPSAMDQLQSIVLGIGSAGEQKHATRTRSAVVGRKHHKKTKRKKKSTVDVSATATAIPSVNDQERVFPQGKALLPMTPDPIGPRESWPWEDREQWQQQALPHTPEIYVTANQITARHAHVIHTWVTQCVHDQRMSTASMWTEWLALLPGFGTPATALQRLTHITDKYYRKQYAKESWCISLQRLARRFPYTYALTQAMIEIWKDCRTLAAFVLPYNITQAQARAMAGKYASVLPVVHTEPPYLHLPDEFRYFYFCDVCKMIYSLVAQSDSPYKQQYAWGLRDALFDLKSRQPICRRSRAVGHRHCQGQPLTRIPLLDESASYLIQFRRMQLMACAQPDCFNVMAWNTLSCTHTEHGPACMSCTRKIKQAYEADWDVSRTFAGPEGGYKCYLCNARMATGHNVYIYGPNTFLCRKHHRHHLVQHLEEQLRLEQTQYDETRIREWIVKYRQDYRDAHAESRAKYNDRVRDQWRRQAAMKRPHR